MASIPQTLRVAQAFDDKKAGRRVDQALKVLEAQFATKLQTLENLVVAQLSDLSTDLGTITAGDFGGDYSGTNITAAGVTVDGVVTVKGTSADSGVVLRATEVEFVNALLASKVELGASGSDAELRAGQDSGGNSGDVVLDMRNKGDLGFREVGTTGATEDAWVEVIYNGATVGYLRIYATK